MKRYFWIITLCLLLYSPHYLQAATSAPDAQSSATIVHEPAYTPLPYEPIKREANTALFGSGLGFAFVLIGGAAVLDRRKK